MDTDIDLDPTNPLSNLYLGIYFYYFRWPIGTSVNQDDILDYDAIDRVTESALDPQMGIPNFLWPLLSRLYKFRNYSHAFRNFISCRRHLFTTYC